MMNLRMRVAQAALFFTLTVLLIPEPAQAASGPLLFGTLDGIRSDGTIIGFAKDVSGLYPGITVKLFFDGPEGNSTNAASVQASNFRADAGASGYHLAIPDALKDGSSHTVYAYAVSPNGSQSDLLLIGSPKSFQYSTAGVLLPETTAALGNGTALTAAQLGLLINDNDPYSVDVGAYYQAKRNIPAANVVHVKLPTAQDLSGDQFTALKAQVDSSLPAGVQAIAVAWVNPSRVVFNDTFLRVNSITSALARGLLEAPRYSPDEPVCAGEATPSPYYNSTSSRPYDDFGMRPAMLLAASSAASAHALIDRGVASDGTLPHGSAHVMYTSDFGRSLRAQVFSPARLGYVLSPFVNVTVDHVEVLTGQPDLLFYFQGHALLTALNQNTYLPGAIGDSLTSTGGLFSPKNEQTPILNWISAGATGSFGTVDEPCDALSKFPDPNILIPHYTNGETLIEAYWKSVPQTFQGLWIGEPLANPWRSNSVAPAKLTANVSAASLQGSMLAPDSIATAFGSRLATGTAVAGAGPLPTNLGGTTITIQDAQGSVKSAPLFYVSPTQVNYEVPPGTATGPAVVTARAADGATASATVQITNLAPGVFMLNTAGLAAADLQRVSGNGSQTFEQVFQMTGNVPSALPIDLGPATDQVYLVLFASGLRAAGTVGISVSIGGVNAPVFFGGAQGFYAGLDQVNVLIPRSLAGRGDVVVAVTAEGIAANPVHITIK